MGAYSLQSCHSNMTTKTKPLLLWFLGNFPMKLGSRKMPLFNLWLLPGFDRVHLFLVPQIPATFSKKSIQQYPKGKLLCLPSYQISAPKRNSILSMSYKRIEKIGNSLCLLDQVGELRFFPFWWTKFMQQNNFSTDWISSQLGTKEKDQVSSLFLLKGPVTAWAQ